VSVVESICMWQTSVPVCLLVEIPATHHRTLIGENGVNVRRIMQQSGARICFPDALPASMAHHASTVHVTGLMSDVLRARQLMLVNYAFLTVLSPVHWHSSYLTL